MEETQGREEIPLRDFDGINDNNDNDYSDYNDYNDKNYWDNLYDETQFDYDENEFKNYKENFDWSDYNVDKLTKSEKDLLALKSFKKYIEMRDRFDKSTSEDVRRIIETIQDDKIRKNVIEAIADREEDSGKVESIELKDILVDSVSRVKFNTNIDDEIWDDDLALEDQEKFYYQQKISNLNQALEEIFIDDDNKDVYDFIDSEITTNIDFNNNKITGYKYKGVDIVELNENSNIFVANESPQTAEFISRVKRLQASSARSIFAEYLESNDTRAIKATAKDYIAELRENQRKTIERRVKDKVTLENIEEAIKDINEQEKVIDDIRKRKGFSLKLDVVKRTVGRSLKYIFQSIRKNPFVFTGALLSIISSLVSLILGIEETKRIVHSIQANIPQAVNEALKNVLTSIYIKYLMEKTSIGQGISRVLSFLGIEGLTLAAFTLIISLGSFSFVIFSIASSILWLFGKPLGVLEYIEYISCVILESQYINSGLKSPHNIAEIIAKYNKTTVEKYYEDLEKRMKNNPRSDSNFLNILAPLARMNISILGFIIKNYQLVVGVIFLGTIYSLYKIVLYLRHLKYF